MKLEKKHWMMLIAGLVILFLVYWFFFRKKKVVTESSYNPAVPIWGIGMGEPAESGYINCGAGLCEIKWDYWTNSNPPEHKSGSYCGSCSTGSPAKSVSVKANTIESNYVSGGGLCMISWTDDKGVKHVEEIPCSRLKDVAAKAVARPSASALGKR